MYDKLLLHHIETFTNDIFDFDTHSRKKNHLSNDVNKKQCRKLIIIKKEKRQVICFTNNDLNRKNIWCNQPANLVQIRS